MQFAAKETDDVRLNIADLIGSILTVRREDAESVSRKGIENFPLIAKKMKIDCGWDCYLNYLF
jgi:hypothetical protein